jgi:hypothetical protein
MAENGVVRLRHEFPALALITGFISHKHRYIFADVLLLWIEARRAASANEGMIAAVRLAWWRDAIKDQNTQAVPLAERLVAHHAHKSLDIAPLTAALDQMITDFAGGGAKDAVLNQWHETIATLLSKIINAPHSAAMATQILMAFDHGNYQSLSQDGDLAMPFRLMRWLLSDPSKLAYPDERPLLALNMMIAVLFRRV